MKGVYELHSFFYHHNILGSRPPQNPQDFSGHRCPSILVFVNSVSYALSSKHINMLDWVVAMLNILWAENHQHIEIKWVGTGKEWVAMGTELFTPLDVFLYQYDGGKHTSWKQLLCFIGWY